MGRVADNILEEMRRSKSGWSQKDFRLLFEGFGFIRKGTKHDIYIHPDYPMIRASVPRHNKLKEWVASKAVKAIDALNERQLKGESK